MRWPPRSRVRTGFARSATSSSGSRGPICPDRRGSNVCCGWPLRGPRLGAPPESGVWPHGAGPSLIEHLRACAINDVPALCGKSPGRVFLSGALQSRRAASVPPWHDVRVSEEQHKAEHRGRPSNDEFRAFVAADWAPRSTDKPTEAEAASYAALRRSEVSAAFPGERLVIPAGGLKVRSNDCDYIFRPHSAFAHLTGLGSDREPDAVLVLEPRQDGSSTRTASGSRSLPRPVRWAKALCGRKM